MSLTYQEIKDQYSALEKTFHYVSSRKHDIIGFYGDRIPDSIGFVGSGSSYCLCKSAELSAQIRLGMPATAFAAGDLLLHHQEYQSIMKRAMLVPLSRSGSTSEVLLALESIQASSDASILGIACAENSKLTEAADLILELPWAFDESVCQTRSVVNLYTAVLLVVAYLSNDQRLIENIGNAIRAGEDFMGCWEDRLAEVACEDWSKAIVLAGGETRGIAEEGALALLEIARIPSQFYHSLDVRHGPMVLVDDDTLVVMCLTENEIEYQKTLINDLLQRGSTVVTYSEQSPPSLAGVRLQVSSGRELGPVGRGIHFILLPQILAYYKAKQKKVNPDQPEGLKAWIKL